MRAEGVVEGVAAGILLNVDAQPLGNLLHVERILQFAHGQKHRQRRYQQDSRRQHQESQPFNGESRAQLATPRRAASRWARLSPSSLHSSRAVAPEAFSTAAVSSTNGRTFSSTRRAATESNSASSSRNGSSEPKSM